MQSKINLGFILSILSAILKFCKDSGLLPSVAIAQAILESSSGTSVLTKRANNLFGIKASQNYKGQKIKMQTSEYVNRRLVTGTAEFRKYDSYADSIEDRNNFLKDNPRYTKAGVFEATSAQQQCDSLQVAGYATDPHYSAKLMLLIEAYDLEQYDNPMLSENNKLLINEV